MFTGRICPVIVGCIIFCMNLNVIVLEHLRFAMYSNSSLFTVLFFFTCLVVYIWFIFIVFYTIFMTIINIFLMFVFVRIFNNLFLFFILFKWWSGCSLFFFVFSWPFHNFLRFICRKFSQWSFFSVYFRLVLFHLIVYTHHQPHHEYGILDQLNQLNCLPLFVALITLTCISNNKYVNMSQEIFFSTHNK